MEDIFQMSRTDVQSTTWIKSKVAAHLKLRWPSPSGEGADRDNALHLPAPA